MVYLRLFRFFVFSCFLLVTADVSGQLVFDLVQDDSSVLATLKLSKLPAEPHDVLLLTFSEKAQDLFGYGPIYEGTFDITSLDEDFGRFELEENGIGLTGRAAITVSSLSFVDLEPPKTSIAGIGPPVRFAITAQDVKGGTDALALRYQDSGVDKSIRATGTWMLVPEPSGMALSSALCVLMAVRRRRKI